MVILFRKGCRIVCNSIVFDISMPQFIGLFNNE